MHFPRSATILFATKPHFQNSFCCKFHGLLATLRANFRNNRAKSNKTTTQTRTTNQNQTTIPTQFSRHHFHPGHFLDFVEFFLRAIALWNRHQRLPLVSIYPIQFAPSLCLSLSQMIYWSFPGFFHLRHFRKKLAFRCALLQWAKKMILHTSGSSRGKDIF